MVEKRFDLRPVVGAEDHDNHDLARRSGAHDHVAHQPLVRACIVERVTVLETETFGFQPDVVRRIGLEPAFADVEHLVEHARNVESGGRSGLDVAAGRHFLVREPPPVGEGEFELVAVELRLRRTHARGDLGQSDLADARQLIAHLVGLEAQLLLVGQILPLAAAADPEVLAEGLGPQRHT